MCSKSEAKVKNKQTIMSLSLFFADDELLVRDYIPGLHFTCGEKKGEAGRPRAVEQRVVKRAVKQAVDAFIADLAAYGDVDVLVLGPQAGYYECKNGDGAVISIKQAGRLVRDRINDLVKSW